MKTLQPAQALQIIKLLSALESWALCQSTVLPAYLEDSMSNTMHLLTDIVLNPDTAADMDATTDPTYW